MAVSRLLIDPSSAKVTAGAKALPMSAQSKEGSCGWGSPEGTSPMTSTSSIHSTLTTVPMSSAATDGGSTRLSRCGQNKHTKMVSTPSVKAPTPRLPIASGSAEIEAVTPPSATSLPSSGSSCTTMMMSPTPEVKPDTTGYGV